MPTAYSRTQIALHWATVILVALQFLLHDGIANAFDDGIDAGTLTITGAALAHMATGTFIMFLAIYRMMERSTHGVPAPPEAEPDWAKKASKLAHMGLYALLLLLPVTGAVAWANASETAGEVHEFLRGALFLLILGHIGAVIMHQFVWKTGLMNRMIRSE